MCLVTGLEEVDAIVPEYRRRSQEAQSLSAAIGRENSPIQGVMHETDRHGQVTETVAVIQRVPVIEMDVIQDFLRGAITALDVGIVVIEVEAQTVEFAQRYAKVASDLAGIRGVIGQIDDVGIGLAVGDIETAADAVQRGVGIEIAELVDRVDLAVVEVEGHPLAGAEDVVLRHVGVEDDALQLRVTDAGHDVAGGFLGDVVVDVDLVRGAGYGGRFHIDLLEVTQPLQSGLGAFDLGAGGPGGFHLAHLPAQHLITGLGIAAEIDAPDIDLFAGIDEEGHADRFAGLVYLGHHVDVGENIALVAQTIGNGLLGFRRQLAREGVARANLDQRSDLFRPHDQLAGDLDFVDLVNLAFLEVYREVDFLLVRCHGHLGGLDLRVDIAPVQIVGTQPLEVSRQFLLRILVVLGIKRQQITGAEFKDVQQLVVREVIVAHDVDLFDGGNLAFGYGDVDIHPVARQFRNTGFDFHTIFAAAVVLAPQFLLDLVQNGAVEHLALGQTYAFQRLFQVIRADILVAIDMHAGDGGALLDEDDEGVAFMLQPDILEESGLEEGLDALGRLTLIEFVADLDGKIVEYGAGRHPLQTLDANILDGEAVGRKRRHGAKQHQTEEGFAKEAIHHERSRNTVKNLKQHARGCGGPTL